MAGGIFPNQPFVLNIKCIVFSIIIILLCMFSPLGKLNGIYLYSAMFLVFVLSYVALAWYDYYYKCQFDPLKTGKISFTGLFKPHTFGLKDTPEREEARELKTKYGFLDHKMIYAFHIIVIVPILLYLAYRGNKSNTYVYPILGFLGIMTLLWHGGKLLFSSHKKL